MSAMLFGKQDISVEKFWKDREEELGTPVLEKVLGQVVGENSTQPTWGLLYTTKKAVYFQTFQSENWMSMIFSGGKGGGGTKNQTIEIPKESIVRFELVLRKKGFLKFLRQPPMVDLVWKDPDTGIENELLFEVESGAEAFVISLPIS